MAADGVHLLLAGTSAGALSAALARLEASLTEAEGLAPLLLGTAMAQTALVVCAGMRASATQAVAGLDFAGDVLSDDDLVGARRVSLRLGRQGLLDDLTGMADTAGTLAAELRKRVRLTASA